MHKELITRLRVGAGIERERVLYIGWSPLANEAADAIEVLEKINDQLSKDVIGLLGVTAERDTLRQQLAEAQAEVSRLEPLQFRQAPCHKFCESTAFEIRIKQLESVCKVALDAIIPVSSYGRIGTKDTEQTALQTAISKLQGVL